MEPEVGGEWRSPLRIVCHCELSAAQSLELDLSVFPGLGQNAFSNHLDTSKVSVAFKMQKIRMQQSYAEAAGELSSTSGPKALGNSYGNGHECAG